MREDQIDQSERKAVLENDRKVLEQRGSTFHQHAVAEANVGLGRYGALGNPTVVGASEATRYPAASAAHQTELPPEPSLGFSIDEMPGSSMAAPSSCSVEATGDPVDAPSSDDGSPATPSGGLMSERAGSSSSKQTGDE
jgi:hypothetical protein